MFLIAKLSDRKIAQFISQLRDSQYSYRDVGATASTIPRSYNIDHNRLRLGSGAAIWERAIGAIKSWEMFRLGWVQLCWLDPPIRAGCDVAILVSHCGFYSLNGARIVYLVNDDGPTKRFGFAYGTLADHAESGEERFVVEWDQDENAVYYDLLAFSRPAQLLSRLAFPVSRLLQKRFAAAFKAAMAAFVDNAR
jgi:uncharacterized protein (UPF0548 family)